MLFKFHNITMKIYGLAVSIFKTPYSLHSLLISKILKVNPNYLLFIILQLSSIFEINNILPALPIPHDTLTTPKIECNFNFNHQKKREKHWGEEE